MLSDAHSPSVLASCMNAPDQINFAAQTVVGPRFLVLLIDDVARTIALEWIVPKDLAALDTACCSNRHRSCFTRILSGVTIRCFWQHCIPWYHHGSAALVQYLQWLSARQMRACSFLALNMEHIPHLLFRIPAAGGGVTAVDLMRSRQPMPLAALNGTHFQRFFTLNSTITAMKAMLDYLCLEQTVAFVAATSHLAIAELEVQICLPDRGEDDVTTSSVWIDLLSDWSSTLTSLNCSCSRGLDDGFLAAVARCQLQALQLNCHHSAFSKQALADTVSKLVRLRELELSDHQKDPLLSTDLLRDAVSRLPLLEKFIIRCTAVDAFAILPALFTHCQLLVEVSINRSFCYYVSKVSNSVTLRLGPDGCPDAMVKVLGIPSFPHPVSVLDCRMVVSEAVYEALIDRICSSAVGLLSWNMNVQLSSALLAVARCSHLQSFTCCYGSSQLLHQLAERHGATLRSISLGWWKALSDEDMFHFLSQCSQLESISLHCCRKLTAHTFANILKLCPELKSIHIAGCRFKGDRMAYHIANSARLHNPFQVSIGDQYWDSSGMKRVLLQAFQGDSNSWRGCNPNGHVPWICGLEGDIWTTSYDKPKRESTYEVCGFT